MDSQSRLRYSRPVMKNKTLLLVVANIRGHEGVLRHLKAFASSPAAQILTPRRLGPFASSPGLRMVFHRHDLGHRANGIKTSIKRTIFC